jgi:hypothetical protein
VLKDGEGREIGVRKTSVQLQLDGKREMMVPVFSAKLALMLVRFGREASMMMRISDRTDFGVIGLPEPPDPD